MEEKRRVLEMLKAGAIGVEEALDLLSALEGGRPEPRPPARLLKVRVEAEEEGRPVKVHLNLPLALASLVESFLPEEAKLTLGRQGVNLKDLLALLKEGVPEGKLVEIEAEEKGPVRILVEVV
ncbi:SHOCT-like domain-containing protein [Thermus sp.]